MPSYPVYPPLVTPFTAADSVDTEALASLVRAVEAGGADGVVPCGTTGEFASLTGDEQRQILETAADAAAGRVIAGVSATSVAGVRERIDWAADAGCDAVLMTAPYFHGENAAGGTRAFVESAAADATLPVYLYNIPVYVGNELAVETVVGLAADGVVDGIKDTSGDLEYLLTLVRETDDDFDVLCGYDSILVPALASGATGGINALANVVPELLDEATSALADGDLDTAVTLSQEGVAPLFEQCATYGFAPATKAGAAARGFLDSTAVRPPLVDLSADERADVAAAVDDALALLDED
jgi:4-hydroxy-tetrahydrodipicolinate synthase